MSTGEVTTHVSENSLPSHPCHWFSLPEVSQEIKASEDRQEKDFPCFSLVVQWLRLHVPSAGDIGLIPGQGSKILHAVWSGKKIKK